jgi:hypothetical protein
MIVTVFFVIVMIALLGWPSSLYLLSRVRVRSPTMLRLALMSLSFPRRRGLERGDVLVLDAARPADARRHQSLRLRSPEARARTCAILIGLRPQGPACPVTLGASNRTLVPSELEESDRCMPM